jgi:succinate dehydrogenase hydrophobic anchor subunit
LHLLVHVRTLLPVCLLFIHAQIKPRKIRIDCIHSPEALLILQALLLLQLLSMGAGK